MIRTHYFSKLEKLLQENRLVFLIGPRRVGKTTLLEYLADKKSSLAYFSADQLVEKNFQNADQLTNYLQFEGIISQKTTTLLIDEAHFLSNVSIILKNLYDQKKFKVVASGSGSLKIYTDLQGHLVGRKINCFMYPLSFADYLKAKNKPKTSSKKWNQAISKSLENEKVKFLDWGGYPEVVTAETKKEKFAAQQKIFDSYFDEDVKYLLAKKDVLAFEKMLPEMAKSVTSLFVIENIRRKTGISYRQIEKIKEILDHTLITKHLPPFSTKDDEIKKHTKTYFVDTGMLKYVLEKEFLNSAGKIAENFVLTELIKYQPKYIDLYFWQRTNSTEIDFILANRINKKLIPIEVKTNSTDNIPRAFNTFVDRYGERVDKLYVVNKDISKTRQYKDKQVVFLPHLLVKEVFDGCLFGTSGRS